MSFYLRLLGGALLMIFALMCGRAYSSYSARAIAELDGFISFMSHVRLKVATQLATQSALCDGFECESLERCGFLPALREGKRVMDAYNKAAIAVCQPARRVLSSFFSGLGRGYRSDELARADSAISECERILAREREQMPKDVKLIYTLLAAISLGLLIFLI